MPRPQFTLRALLVAMLVVASFFGGIRFGIRFERERAAREMEAERQAAIDLWTKQAIEEDVCGGTDGAPLP